MKDGEKFRMKMQITFKESRWRKFQQMHTINLFKIPIVTVIGPEDIAGFVYLVKLDLKHPVNRKTKAKFLALVQKFKK